MGKSNGVRCGRHGDSMSARRAIEDCVRAMVESLEQRLMLAGDLQVRGIVASGDAENPFGKLEITFNQGVQEASFTTDDVQLVGAGDPIAPLAVTRLASDRFELDFTGLAEKAVYRLQVGPDILDESGMAMDQDGDANVGEADGDVYRATLIASDALIEDLQVGPDNTDLLVCGASVRLQGSHAFTGVTLASGSTLVIDGGTTTTIAGALHVTGNSQIIAAGVNIDGQVDGVWAGEGVRIDASDVFVETGSTISADEQGYAGYSGGGGRGPGVSGEANERGGGYGGIGGSSDANPNPVYGDAFAPVGLGSSGGGGFWGTGGSGGGAVTLNVSGRLQLDGQISADGQSIADQNGGGGSGGSIQVHAHTLAGSGSFSARGGSNTTHGGGGGGGGRVAVYFEEADTYSGFAASSISGGTGSRGAGQSGTIVFVDTSVANNHLHIYGDFVLSQDTVATYNGITVANGATLTIGGGSVITVENALHVVGNSKVLAQGKNTGGKVSDAWAGQGVSIVASNLFVEAGSAISADGQGYIGRWDVPGVGPGAYDTTTHAGGTYGGQGSGNPVATYGDPLAPTDLGSAGGYWTNGRGGNGGGAIRIRVSDTLRLEGEISADGQNVADGVNGGGGSGGSIYVTAQKLAGAGFFSAMGGASPQNRGGGGGGGRIAVHYVDAAAYTGFSASTAAGGAGAGDAAGVGTVVFIDTSVAGSRMHVYENLVFGQDTLLSVDALTVTDGGTLVVGGGSKIEVTGDIVVGGLSRVILQGRNTGGQVNGQWAGSGVSISARNLTVEEGSVISADAQGYIGRWDNPGLGPGAYDTTTNAGGTYGGAGGGNPVPTYGDPLMPLDLGSAGGYWTGGPGGHGGGAIQLYIGDTLRIDGEISADGQSILVEQNGGGGSGGSIFVIAPVVVGAGLFSADGGSNITPQRGGGGGGGRIAIHTGRYDSTATLQAKGGNGNAGGAGGQVSLFLADAGAVSASLLTVPGGTGINGSGASGTALLQKTLEFLWTGQVESYLHGVESLNWMGLCVDPGLELAEIVAVKDGQTYSIASDLSSIGSIDWDTRDVPDGIYELRANFRNASGLLGQARRTVLVNNAAQWHSGQIETNQTWGSDRVHIVESDLTIASGATLTIEPGAVVKFLPGTGVTIAADAVVNAAGTENAPIVLTSILDGSIGGATNPDSARLAARAGDWHGLSIQGNGQLNLGEHVDQRYMVVVHAGALTTSETWQNTAIHYVVDDVAVPAGMTLTIQPGAIVQFGLYKGLSLATGSQLIAQGSVAQPIRFTSIRDDSFGDNNQDGNQTTPAAGDWRWIYLDGAQAVLDHVDMRYGGGNAIGLWDGTGMIRTSGEASLNVSNSLLRDGFYDGILVWGGEATIHNSVLSGMDRAISAHPDSVVQVINCTVDDNRVGLLGHGGALEVSNTIVSNSLYAGIQHDFGTEPVVRYTNVWQPTNSLTRYLGMLDLTGQNGNIAVDPRYRSAAEGNYRLRYGSPVIDAGDGAMASGTDLMGSPRYDDPRTSNTGVAMGNGALPDLGAYEFIEHADSNLDLTVSEINGPSVMMAGQTAKVTWTDTNRGTAPLSGAWHNTISLVLNPGPNQTVIPVADVLVAADVTLVPGQSVRTSAVVNVPGGIPSDYYWRVEANTRGEVFEGNNRANNVAVSARTVALDLPSLEADGDPSSGQFSLAGQAAWFKWTPASEQDLQLVLQSQSPGSGIELYAARGYVPTPSQFQFKSAQFGSSSPTLLIDAPLREPYYVTAYARTLEAPADYTLAVRTLAFALDSASPSAISNAGPVTLELRGGQLRADDTYQLISPTGAAISASKVQLQDSTAVYATFNLSGATVGLYDVSVTRGQSQVILTDTVTVAAPAAASLETSILLPSRFRVGRPFTGHVVYRNSGNYDITAPIFVLSANQQAGLRLSSDEEFTTDGLVLIGGSFEGPAGILRPGQEWRIPFSAVTSSTTDLQFQLGYKLANATDLVDWPAVEAQVRPAEVEDALWQPVWQRFASQAGTTWGGWVKAMADYATLLGQQGGTFYSAREVFRTALLDSYRATRSSVAGTLTLGNGGPAVANALLLLSNSDGSEAGAAVSRADGSFDFLNLPAGTYTLTVRNYLLSQPVQLTIPSTGAVTGLSIEVSRGGTVTGIVRQETDNARLSEVAVRLRHDGRTLVTHTDENGLFTFRGLSDGSYDLSVGGGTWETEYRDAIVIAAGDSISNLEFSLASASTLQGQVLAAGFPLPGANVSLVDSAGHVVASATAAEGDYFFDGLAAGSYTLSVSAAGYAPLRTAIELGNSQSVSLAPLALVPGATVTLTIADALAVPVTRGIVQFQQDGRSLDWLPIGENGQVSFTHLASGTYAVQVQAEGFRSYSQTLVVDAAESLSRTIVLDAAGMIRGTVTDGAGQPIANIRVNALAEDGEGNLRRYAAATGNDGTYRITDLPFGTFAITVGNNHGIGRQDITLDPDHLEGTADFIVAGAGIHGTILGSDGLTPAARATVLLMQDGQVLATATTTADGAYRFRGLAAGSYVINAASHLGIASAQSITINANEDAAAVPLSLGGQTLRGTVTGADGVPLSNASVVLVPLAAPSLAVHLLASGDDQGRFSFAGVAPGEYLLVVTRPGHAAVRLPITFSTSTEITVPLAIGLTASGTVADAGGQAIDSATVLFIDATTRHIAGSAVTDARGQYAAANLPAGTYDVLIRHKDYQLTTAPGVVVAADLAGMDITLQAPTTVLQGHVYDDAGQPIANAQVAFVNAAGDVVLTTLTGFDGSFGTQRLSPGQYSLVASILGYRVGLAQDVTVQAGDPVEQNLTVTRAGTDDSGAYGWFVDALLTAFKKFIEDRNPEPEKHPEDNFPALPLPEEDCVAAAQAWVDAVFLADCKNSAYDRWVANHQSFNDTVVYGSLIFAAQGANFIGSIATMVFSGGLSAELEAAAEGAKAITYVDEATLLALNLVKNGMAILSTTEAALSTLIDAAQGGALEAEDVMGMFNDLGALANDLAGQLDQIDQFGGLDGSGSFTSNLMNGLGALTSFISLVLGTYSSIQQFSNQANTVTDARDAYLDYFAKYKAARAALANANANCKDKPDPDKSPKPGNTTPGSRGSVPSGTSVDPNDKLTIGVGARGFIRGDQTISYTIDFENQPSATLPAQRVTITDQLSSNLDWSTLQLTGIGFNGVTLSIPPGLANYEVTTFVASDPNPVSIRIAFDSSTGILTWIIESIDPVTGQPPEDPLAGFLPPNNAQHQGEGFVTFTIQPKPNLANLATIQNQARIVFDDNQPIDTNQTLNTIDLSAPASGVRALPVAVGKLAFPVSWAAKDGTTSGTAGYDVYVSERGRPYKLWLSNTPARSAMFTGRDNSWYSFYTVARDGVGNVELLPAKADATTVIDRKAPTAKLGRLAGLTPSAKVYTFQVTYSDNYMMHDRSIGPKDVTVTGPNKFSQYATLVAKKSIKGGRYITATYQITAPGGTWDGLDDGQYTLWMTAKQVSDAAGNLVAAQKLGTFTASIRSRSAPTRSAPLDMSTLRFSDTRVRMGQVNHLPVLLRLASVSASQQRESGLFSRGHRILSWDE